VALFFIESSAPAFTTTTTQHKNKEKAIKNVRMG